MPVIFVIVVNLVSRTY